METSTHARLLHDEARIARLEDWISVVRARARDLSRVGLNAVLLVALWLVVNLVALGVENKERA